MRDLMLVRRTKDIKIKGEDYIQTYWTMVVKQSEDETEVIKYLNESDLLELQEQIKEALHYKPSINDLRG